MVLHWTLSRCHYKEKTEVCDRNETGSSLLYNVKKQAVVVCQLLQSIALLQLLFAWDPKRGLQRKRAAQLKCWQSRWSGVSLGEKGAKFSPIAVGNGKGLKEAELPLCPAAAPCSRVTAIVMHGSW